MDKHKKALIDYVNTASDLAESVRRNVQQGGKIDNKTVIALNNFIIAANAAADLKNALTEDDNEGNLKLN